jgi:hypothetical protein
MLARPAGLEPAAFCLEGAQYKILSARLSCRLRGNVSFISLLNWTEVGLKLLACQSRQKGALPPPPSPLMTRQLEVLRRTAIAFQCSVSSVGCKYSLALPARFSCLSANSAQRSWHTASDGRKQAISYLRICGPACVQLLLNRISYTTDSRSQPTDVPGMQ